MQLVVVLVDALGERVDVGALRRIRRPLCSQAGIEKRGGEEQEAAAPDRTTQAHWPSVWEQLLPPAGSNLMMPDWSEQKARSPVEPTVWGTAVTL